MSTVAPGRPRGEVPGAPAQRRLLHRGTLLTGLFGLLPLWWALGVGAFIWLIMAVPMALWLTRRPQVRLPRGIGLWALFVCWVLVSSTQLPGDFGATVAFTFRTAVYTAGGIMLVYTYNVPRDELPTERLVATLAGLWTSLVLFGVLALFVPDLSFHSLTELLLPRSLRSTPFVHQLVHPRLAQVQTFLGYPLPRPNAPFTYTNEWGSYAALLTPVYLFWLQSQGPGRSRTLGRLMVVVGMVPILLSANRGLWLSLTVGLLYGAARLALRGRVQVLMNLLMVIAVVGILIAVTPVGSVVGARLEDGHSDTGRLKLYQASTEGILTSPLIGYGGPRPLAGANDGSPPVGTHGQAWLVAFSHGLPGLGLFLGFLLLLLWHTRGGSPTSFRFWAHVTIFIGIVQTPFYSLLPAQIPLLMVLGGLCLRDRAAETT